MVADSAFAAIEFLAAVCSHIRVATRPRLDANIFAPAPPKRQGRGRPSIKGQRLPKRDRCLHDRYLHDRYLRDRCLRDTATVWRPHAVALWQGRKQRLAEIASDTAVWHHPGKPPVPIRRILARMANALAYAA